MATTEYTGNAIPAPGFRTGGKTVDRELLYSTVGYTQNGVTLKAGQGVLPLGTILSYETSTKRYIKYTNSGNATVPAGILRDTVDTGLDTAGAEYLNNIVILGLLKLSHIQSANSSGQIASAITALGASTNDTLGFFKL